MTAASGWQRFLGWGFAEQRRGSEKSADVTEAWGVFVALRLTIISGVASG
jgi:hypothetical protein